MNITRQTPKGIEASGPYSPAIELVEGSVKLLYVSGQGPRNPQTGQKEIGDIARETTLTMENLKSIVSQAGYQMDEIVKVTVFLTSIADIQTMNGIYKTYFSEGKYPARSTVAVKELPGGQHIEIEAIACKTTE